MRGLGAKNLPEEILSEAMGKGEAEDYMSNFDDGKTGDKAKTKPAVSKLAPGDLSIDEDAAFALMHMISLEEHLLMTCERTGDDFYPGMLLAVREKRKRLLESMFGGKVPEGETWCIAKHLLGCSMRLMETGVKKLSSGNRNGAKADFRAAVDMWGMFFVITGKVDRNGAQQVERTVPPAFPFLKKKEEAETGGVSRKTMEKETAEENPGRRDEPDIFESPHEKPFLSGLREKVLELVSCCIE